MTVLCVVDSYKAPVKLTEEIVVAMADAAGSTSSWPKEPESSSKVVHRQSLDHEPESAALPEYSQQPVEGIDMLVQVISNSAIENICACSGVAGYGALRHAPSTSNSFIFSSLWGKSDSQLPKYCVVCEISWCRCQQLTSLH